MSKQDLLSDLKEALEHINLHDKDKFMLDNIVATLEDNIDEIRSS